MATEKIIPQAAPVVIDLGGDGDVVAPKGVAPKGDSADLDFVLRCTSVSPVDNFSASNYDKFVVKVGGASSGSDRGDLDKGCLQFVLRHKNTVTWIRSGPVGAGEHVLFPDLGRSSIIGTLCRALACFIPAFQANVHLEQLLAEVLQNAPELLGADGAFFLPDEKWVKKCLSRVVPSTGITEMSQIQEICLSLLNCVAYLILTGERLPASIKLPKGEDLATTRLAVMASPLGTATMARALFRCDKKLRGRAKVFIATRLHADAPKVPKSPPKAPKAKAPKASRALDKPENETPQQALVREYAQATLLRLRPNSEEGRESIVACCHTECQLLLDSEIRNLTRKADFGRTMPPKVARMVSDLHMMAEVDPAAVKSHLQMLREQIPTIEAVATAAAAKAVAKGKRKRKEDEEDDSDSDAAAEAKKRQRKEDDSDEDDEEDDSAVPLD